MQEDRVKDAVLKVALGYSIEEVTEEYGVENGELKLVKRKETRKDVPPDLKAAKLLLDGKDYSALSDEELEAERARLYARLKEEYDDGRSKSQGGGEAEDGPCAGAAGGLRGEAEGEEAD